MHGHTRGTHRHDPCTAEQSESLLRPRPSPCPSILQNRFVNNTMGMGGDGGWAGASQRRKHREMLIGYLQHRTCESRAPTPPPRPTSRLTDPACHGNSAHESVEDQARIKRITCMRPSTYIYSTPGPAKCDSPRACPIPRGELGDFCVPEAAAWPPRSRCNESDELL